MADELLVRAYNVGVGDCIYVRIPDDDNDGFHILIDCGTIGRMDLLRESIGHLKEMLPAGEAADSKRLDLLVATHRHRDHIKGFDPDLFEDVEIQNIWLSVAMKPDHPQAAKSNALRGFATKAMRSLAAQRLLSPELQVLASLYSISNTGAMNALREILPGQNDVEPRFVHAGESSETIGIELPGDTRIDVLAPEWDIDRFYLGEDEFQGLMGLQGASEAFRGRKLKGDETPRNIDAEAFRVLRARLLSNVLAFVETDSRIQNNTSVVLLITWKGKRLLFVGDAEWEGEFKEGKHNGSWNVMWNQRRADLDQPLDFLKIGHHGSENASPWRADRDAEYEVNQILDAILPRPAAGAASGAMAVVSTARTSTYPSIPEAPLLAELGQRLGNAKQYDDAFKATPGSPSVAELPFSEREVHSITEPQALRTDFEDLLNQEPWADVKVKAG